MNLNWKKRKIMQECLKMLKNCLIGLREGKKIIHLWAWYRIRVITNRIGNLYISRQYINHIDFYMEWKKNMIRWNSDPFFYRFGSGTDFFQGRIRIRINSTWIPQPWSKVISSCSWQISILWCVHSIRLCRSVKQFT